MIESIKIGFKKTLLNRVVRPRSLHAFGVGAPKTGTHSVARLFSNYRAAHEGLITEVIHLARRKEGGYASQSEIRGYLRHRDQNQRWEADIGHPLIYFAEELVEMYPEAKFIITVRHPRNWLRSMIDLSINHSWPSDLPATDPRHVWKVHRHTNLGGFPKTYPSEELVLQEKGVRPVDAFLKYWSWHNERALRIIPEERRLILRTKSISSSTHDIAQLCGIEKEKLSQDSHAWSTKQKHGLLQKLYDDYIRKRVIAQCEETISKLNNYIAEDIVIG